MLSQFTRGAQRFPLPILKSMSLRRATFSGFRSPSGVRLSRLQRRMLRPCAVSLRHGFSIAGAGHNPAAPAPVAFIFLNDSGADAIVEARTREPAAADQATPRGTDHHRHLYPSLGSVYRWGERRSAPDWTSITPAWAAGYSERLGISPPVWASPPTPRRLWQQLPRRRSGRRQQHL